MNENTYTCFYCHITHDQVECQGIWYCPNALCTGPGGAWFRGTLKSYMEVPNGRHTVDEKEWLKKGTAYMENKYGEEALALMGNRSSPTMAKSFNSKLRRFLRWIQGKK